MPQVLKETEPDYPSTTLKPNLLAVWAELEAPPARIPAVNGAPTNVNPSRIKRSD
jgi:hypothetical protein